MLNINGIDVDKEEESLRLQIQSLTDEDRKIFYKEVKTKIKDPDTYATLNWFFISGIHHFYLENWLMGVIDLVIFVIGVILITTGQIVVGIVFIAVISIIELWALFRSQIIIQDYNNQIYKKTLNYLNRKNI